MTLPWWLQWAQAIAVIAIPAVGAWLAWQQVRIADAKLQHDLYERRFRVFDATRRFLAETNRKEGPSGEDQRMFIVETADAAFLFDDHLARYLEELLQRATWLRATTDTISRMRIDGEQRIRALAEQENYAMSLNDELVGLVDRFKPFLRLDKRQREAGCWQAMAARFRRNVLRLPDS